MGCTNLYVQVWVTDGVSDLLKRSSCCKHRKGACKRDHAGCCQTGCHAHHVAFCDTAVDKTLWTNLFEGSGFGSSCKVSVEHHEIWIFCRKLRECSAVAFAGRNLFYFCHSFNTFPFRIHQQSSAASCCPSSSIACRYCSSFGAVPCQEA